MVDEMKTAVWFFLTLSLCSDVVGAAVTAAGVGAGADAAGKVIGVVDKGVDLLVKVDKILTDKLNAHFNAVAKRPEPLLKPGDLEAVAKNLKPGTAISYENLKGFDGITEYQPPGWKIEMEGTAEKKEQDSPAKPVFGFPLGVGNVMMTGCFGSGYQAGDPCYEVMRFKTRCASNIASANFIGVGFDISNSYSSDSRKKSVVQRVCSKKVKFMDQPIPDNMNAYGIYDYSVHTQTFQSVDRYREYLAKKSGTAMSAGVFKAVSREFQQTSSAGSSGFLHDVGVGVGVGGKSESKSGSKSGKSLRRQMGSSGSKTSQHFISILEADLKLYEIALDHATPDDLSATFLEDFINLPNSYYLIGADIKLQDFVLRYGTHYIKSAKFGGKLSIFKTSTSTSKMSETQFAVAAEKEFSAMMSTLQSSYVQTQVKANFFGTGFQSNTKNQQSSGSKNENTKNSKQSTESGGQSNARSQFIETTVDVLGGDPEVAAIIMDFYTPAFKGRFVKWLTSLQKYPKPYDMTFGRIADLFDVNVRSLFKEGTPHAGCFGPNVKRDTDGTNYFLRQKKSKDDKNQTTVTTEKFICKYGKNREKFMEDFKAKRLALERAITIFVAEGPFSTSSFELPPGDKGCETNTLDYTSDTIKMSKSWPRWNDMLRTKFKVLFQLPWANNVMGRDVEFKVKHSGGIWFSAHPKNQFRIDNTCPSARGLPAANRVCVGGLNLVYNENTGYFTFDQQYYKSKTTMEAKLANPYEDRLIARAEDFNMIENLQTNKLGEIPCNVKWSNAHRINPIKRTSCIHFSAASEGDIFLVFATIPRDHKTWYYLQMSPTGVAFYRAMELLSKDTKRGAGTLGDASLFETFFVCVRQGDGKNKDLQIMYGKAPAQREIGTAISTFNFPHSAKETVSYYTFGSGEAKITVDDVRIVGDKPHSIICSAGLIKVDDDCVMDCHRFCKGCHKAQDPKGCTECSNLRYFYNNDQFECVGICPAKTEPETMVPNGLCAKCKPGYYKNVAGNGRCKKCARGYYQAESGQDKCLECELGHFCGYVGMARYTPCPVNMYQDAKGGVTCKVCPRGKESGRGSSSCGNACKKGTFLAGSGCVKCSTTTYAPAAGMDKCVNCPAGKKSNNERTGCQDIDECVPNPCRNGARCRNLHNAFKCECTPGWTGKTCEADVNECLTANVCNNGKCLNNHGSYTCRCNAGYTGKNCKGDVDECTTQKNSVCNRGTCVNTLGSYTCKDCAPGFKGSKCTDDVDECAKNPCKYGKCVNTVGSYTCNCEGGYQGKHCDQVACHETFVDFNGAGLPKPGGGTFIYKNIASWGACSLLCMKNKDCRAFGYATPEFPHRNYVGNCWLKNGDYENVRKPTKGLISGFVPQACSGGSCLDSKVNFNKADLRGAFPNVASANNCADLCEDKLGCRGFTYGTGADVKGKCWLKNGNYELGREPKNVFTSGTVPISSCGELKLTTPILSSTKAGRADDAIDNDLSTMAVTKAEASPWLQVKLKHRARIDRVYAYLDGPAYKARKYQRLKVEVRMTDKDPWRVCEETDASGSIAPFGMKCRDPYRSYGQFVKISIANNNLHLREVKILGTYLYDLPLKNPRQSSVYNNRANNRPERAIDGKLNTCVATGSKDVNPWWFAEFHEPVALVAEVHCYLNGYGMKTGTYNYFKVETWARDGDGLKLCWDGKVTGEITPFVVRCRQPQISKYVRISIRSQNVLYLQEIKVVGKYITDVSLNMDAQQSGTYNNDPKWGAGRAVDGDFNTNSVSVSGGTSWWSVTLRYVVRIEQILCYLNKWALDTGKYRRFKVETRIHVKEGWGICINEHDIEVGPHDPYAVVCEDRQRYSKYVKISTVSSAQYMMEVRVMAS